VTGTGFHPAFAAVALAAVLDAVLAEPPRPLHPVAWFGRAVAPLDRAWPAPTPVSAAVALLFPLVAAAVAAAAVALAAVASTTLGVVAAGLVLFVCLSLRMLLAEASSVVAATESDLPTARRRLRSLAGRDPTDLSAGAVRSAAVESLGENLADGLVAPLLAFGVAAALVAAVASPSFVLPVAAGAAAWVKAVNTLDSMLGYRSKPVGRVPARLDDAVMFVPARAAAILLAVAAGRPRALVTARRAARAPPSPNSGWPMATLAAVLGVRLLKPGVYDLDFGDLPTVAEAARASRVVRRAGVVSYLLAGVLVWS
jgi:adenosylcobinamide-phosphate synthase